MEVTLPDNAAAQEDQAAVQVPSAAAIRKCAITAERCGGHLKALQALGIAYLLSVMSDSLTVQSNCMTGANKPASSAPVPSAEPDHSPAGARACSPNPSCITACCQPHGGCHRPGRVLCCARQALRPVQPGQSSAPSHACQVWLVRRLTRARCSLEDLDQGPSNGHPEGPGKQQKKVSFANA